MTFRRISLVVIVLAALAAGWWFLYGRGPKVTMVTPSRGTAVEIVYATGAVEPVRWAKVASLIRGRIVYLCYCEGKPVKKDEVLVRLDDGELQAQLSELMAREDFLKREMERVTELRGRGASTVQAFERASSELRRVQALIAVQKEKLSDYKIVAPMDGIVLRRDGEVGEIADAGQVLFRVGVPKPLEVVAEVNEEDIPRVVIGQQVLLRTDAFPNQRLDGKVREITPMGDPLAKTYRIHIDLPEDTPLRPGMSVEANVITREKANALLVPADAVQGNAVFLVNGERAHKHDIKAGIRGTRAVEILEGLKESDHVVAPIPPAGLKDGQRVRASERQPS